MTGTILRAADRVAQPWKNGGGTTREVIAAPSSGASGDFDWRVSMAEVAVAGPFSSFPGIDRTLKVLEGALALTFTDPHAEHVLTPQTPALDFPGDVAVTGRPLDGPVLDLNLMVRRGAFRGSIEDHLAGTIPAIPDILAVLMLIALRPTTAWIGEVRHELAHHDALHLSPAGHVAPLRVDGPVLVLRVASCGV